jgi:hypothetical protein
MRPPRDQIVSLACGALSAVAAVGAILASQNGSLHPSALVKISDQDPIAAYATAADPHFHLVNLAQHYDGTYYYAMARDPFLTGHAHTLIDQPAYRYGHPLHGWLAGLLSLGNARAVPIALLLLSLLGMAIAGWAVSRLGILFGRTAWAGLLIAVSPGILYSTTVDTTEALGAGLLALTMLAWVRHRFTIAGALIVLVCLDKEQYVVVPVGLALWELIAAARRHARPSQLPTKIAAVAIGPAVLAGWYVYVHGQLGSWPWNYEPGNFGAPGAGWREAFRIAHDLSGGEFDQAQIGNLTPVVLVAIAAIILIALACAVQARTVLDIPMIGLAVITSMQGWRTLLYPHELFRTTAIAVLFAVAVLFTRDRSSPRATDEPDAASIASGACPDTP